MCALDGARRQPARRASFHEGVEVTSAGRRLPACWPLSAGCGRRHAAGCHARFVDGMFVDRCITLQPAAVRYKLCSFRRGGATYQYRRYGILDATAPRGLGCAAGDQLYSPALVDVSAPPPPSCTGGRQASGGRMELLPGEGFAIVVIASLTAVAGAVVPAPG
ncbi:unnamed protein product [Prorocentrum cordatum]|uniref:Uncharacterized protein n=1 Tax=Prorocentrum cordatum TaxID=2364126 RepID=A0ABN9QI30_9DINO|nr:unnamed protein product [Polarella glacialis]